MKKKKLKGLVYLLAALCLSLAAFLAILYHQTARDAATRIERGAIENVIFSESPVYYDDGKTPIGVFFEKTHRKYIQYKDVPKTFLKAIIAAEDRSYFHHPGFDIRAIVRAMIANIRARKIVQGGSTITQQTAKNIFKRHKRSYMAKLRELMQALLLESKYSKEEILEMYVNQFFVTGFGRGLRIAAHYFFDKDAEDLDLVESAFIAGAVKGPYRYNPFIKKTEAEKAEARRLAKLRKDYVLTAMHRMNFITEEEYQDAKEKEIPFREGKVTYRLNVILDYVREQLESGYLRAALHEQGVDNIATSGIKIYTSINREIQEGALRTIRGYLPLLDVRLSGYRSEPSEKKYGELAAEGLKKSKGNLPFFCRITHINRDRVNPSVIVAWDKGGGIIDYEGMKPVGEAWLKWKLGNRAVFDRARVADFLKNLKEGDLVAVQQTWKKDGQTQLVLSRIPELDGGIIVLRKGMIKAMVGGFFDRFFNRAVDAKRQLGSIFKPLVYAAALQLKWNSLDPLTNMRDAFQFENTFYLPKPDHEPAFDRVSMAWAGVKSENLATVWLLYHLTDHLNMSEFRQVVELLGLSRKAGEAYAHYVKRIRDKYGVVVDREALMEAAFEEAKKQIRSDLIFKGYEEALENLRRLHFNIESSALNPENLQELQIRGLSFHRLRNLNFEMKRSFKNIQGLIDIYRQNKSFSVRQALMDNLFRFYIKEDLNNGARLFYAGYGHPSHLTGLKRLTPEWLLQRSEPLSAEKVWIDGLVPSEVVDLLQTQLKENYKGLLARKRYDLEVLSRVRDFRTLVSLRYVTHVSEKMGISTRLDPVLSFPLGANSISIIEAALAYQSIMTGHVYPLSDKLTPSMVPVITKIVDREGETIWEYRPQPRKVLSDRVSGLVSEILQKVIEEGTGRRAKNAVHLSLNIEGERIDIPIPSFGKTGTADQFTNSSFVGFIPGPQKASGRLDAHEGYVIGSYVGYDDNRPMKGGNTVIYGASGALPLWIQTANIITNSREYRKDLQVADLAFNSTQAVPVITREGLRPITVSSVTGLPLRQEEAMISEHSTQILSHIDVKEDILRLKRVFEPLTGAYYVERY